MDNQEENKMKNAIYLIEETCKVLGSIFAIVVLVLWWTTTPVEAYELPEFELPKLSMPEIEMPKITVPEVPSKVQYCANHSKDATIVVAGIMAAWGATAVATMTHTPAGAIAGSGSSWNPKKWVGPRVMTAYRGVATRAALTMAIPSAALTFGINFVPCMYR